MKKDTTAKLADVEARMRRWHTRLTRASNMLQKLEKQRRRLTLQQQVGVGRPSSKIVGQKSADVGQKLAVETDHISELDLPAFLDRRNPDGIRKAAREMQEKADAQLVDKLKQQRKSKEEADKHKMPLTGRAALDAIRPKRKKAS